MPILRDPGRTRTLSPPRLALLQPPHALPPISPGWAFDTLPVQEKVWLALEEKRVPYRVQKVNMNCYGDKPGWFWAMQPSGGIPVAQIDGRVISCYRHKSISPNFKWRMVLFRHVQR